MVFFFLEVLEKNITANSSNANLKAPIYHILHTLVKTDHTQFPCLVPMIYEMIYLLNIGGI